MALKVADLEKPLRKGIRLKVVFVPAPKPGDYVDDAARLLGETGSVERHLTKPIPQIHVRWDTKQPGHLMLIGEDEIELLKERS